MPNHNEHCAFCKKKFEGAEIYTGYQTADGQILACNQCSRLIIGIKDRLLLRNGIVKNQQITLDSGHNIAALAKFLEKCTDMAEISNTTPRIEEVRYPDPESWILEVRFCKS